MAKKKSKKKDDKKKKCDKKKCNKKDVKKGKKKKKDKKKKQSVYMVPATCQDYYMWAKGFLQCSATEDVRSVSHSDPTLPSLKVIPLNPISIDKGNHVKEK